MRRVSILIFPIIGLLLLSCSSGEISRLRSENAALRKTLQEHQPEITGMHNMNAWLDSIDGNRNLLHHDSNRILTPRAVTFRLHEVNRYVITSAVKLTGFEYALRQSQQAVSGYQLMIDALRNEARIRDEEVKDLEATLSVFQRAHMSLTRNTTLREDSVTALHEELSLLQAKVDGLAAYLRLKEGDVMYARGKAAQEAARRARTTVAQRRDAYREALEVFRKAHSLGNQEAAGSIEELEWILLTDPDLHPVKPSML